MLLKRDKLGDEHVESREQYLEYLKKDIEECLGCLLGKHDNVKSMYEVMSDFEELYGCLKTQLLSTKTELGTKARHKAQYDYAKKRAEDLGGYFNGITEVSNND